jgi:hypothetical protein
MARGNNQSQSSVRSEVGDSTSRFLNGLKNGFLSGEISSKEEYKKYVRDFPDTEFKISDSNFSKIAPRSKDEERSLKASLKKLQGFDEFGFTTQTQNLSTYQSAKGYDNETFTKQASGLSDLLNDMVAKGQGGSKLFKEIDSLYQDIKTARGGDVGKTTKLDGGRVFDASGDNFNLASKVGGFDEAKKWFNPMKKAELTAGEMYTVVRDLPTIASRLRDKAYVAGTGQEVVERYLPAKYRNVDSIDSPAWFKVTLQRNSDGYAPVKVKYVTTDKEKQIAKDQYRG